MYHTALMVYQKLTAPLSAGGMIVAASTTLLADSRSSDRGMAQPRLDRVV
jgi:hypothetical protein